MAFTQEKSQSQSLLAKRKQRDKELNELETRYGEPNKRLKQVPPLNEITKTITFLDNKTKNLRLQQIIA